MAIKAYVTGFHGAGTHSCAQYLAEQSGALYLPETVAKRYDLEAALNLASGMRTKYEKNARRLIREPSLDRGFVLQCPFLASDLKRLSDNAEVYWLTRNHNDLIRNMVGRRFDFTFEVLRKYRELYPKDPVWELVKYDGSEDVFYGYVGHCALFVKIKDYLLNKYYLSHVTVIQAEDMPYWDESKATAYDLSQKQIEIMNYHLDQWNEVKADLI
jgi:hypothetical protein